MKRHCSGYVCCCEGCHPSKYHSLGKKHFNKPDNVTAQELAEMVSDRDTLNFERELLRAYNNIDSIDPNHGRVCYRRDHCAVKLYYIKHRDRYSIEVEGSICKNHAAAFLNTFHRTIKAVSRDRHQLTPASNNIL